jgi:poly-gamma-glutamate capsule biosynthesis protein CapA/YwtB (metallophosphatase superfamily)
MRSAIYSLSTTLAVGIFAASALLTRAQEVESQVNIEVGGDVLPESSWQDPGDVEHLFDGMKGEFARSELVFVNLEEPITASNRATRYKSRAAVRAGLDYILKARNPRISEVLKESGIGLVGLANNHMMDYGGAGLSDTLAAFRSAGLPAVGAGREADAEQPYIFEKGGIKVAMLAFSDVVPTDYAATPTRRGVASSQPETRLVSGIQAARKNADFVVLMIHWGGQGNHRITQRQRELARAAVEAGCDAVVGMHPHVLQGIEFIGAVPVFYSVGNLAFPSNNPAANECILVRLGFQPKRLAAVDLVPVEISPSGAPRVATGEEAAEIDSHLDQYCRGFNTAIQGGKVVEIPRRQKLVYATEKRARRRGRS